MRDPRPTAAVIIIGNEILSGKVQEANAAFLIERLRGLGVRLRRMVFIEDTVADILATVRSLSERYDYVLTTGGIGPTHDDLTVAAVAAAFDVPVEPDPELLRRIEAHFGDACTEVHRRFALTPRGSAQEGDDPTSWPTLRMRNVWVFPGVPSLLRKKFDQVAHRFEGAEIWLVNVYLTAHESDIDPELAAVVAAHPDVEIGSYPRVDDDVWTLRLTIESTKRDAVVAASMALQVALAERITAVEEPSSSAQP